MKKYLHTKNKKIAVFILTLILIFSIVVLRKFTKKTDMNNNDFKPDIEEVYDGPDIRIVGEKTYNFSHIRDESE